MLMMLASSGWALLPCLKTGLLVGQSKNRQDFVRVLYAIGSSFHQSIDNFLIQTVLPNSGTCYDS